MPRTAPPDSAWEPATWQGNRRAPLRHGLSLTLRERLQAVEDRAQVAQRLAQMRERDARPQAQRSGKS